jgi:hypothetical protein
VRTLRPLRSASCCCDQPRCRRSFWIRRDMGFGFRRGCLAASARPRESVPGTVRDQAGRRHDAGAPHHDGTAPSRRQRHDRDPPRSPDSPGVRAARSVAIRSTCRLAFPGRPSLAEIAEVG